MRTVYCEIPCSECEQIIGVDMPNDPYDDAPEHLCTHCGGPHERTSDMPRFFIIDIAEKHLIHGAMPMYKATIDELETNTEEFYDYFTGLPPTDFKELFDDYCRHRQDYTVVEVTKDHPFFRSRS